MLILESNRAQFQINGKITETKLLTQFLIIPHHVWDRYEIPSAQESRSQKRRKLFEVTYMHQRGKQIYTIFCRSNEHHSDLTSASRSQLRHVSPGRSNITVKLVKRIKVPEVHFMARMELISFRKIEWTPWKHQSKKVLSWTQRQRIFAQLTKLLVRFLFQVVFTVITNTRVFVH